MTALEILAAWCGASFTIAGAWCALVVITDRVHARRRRRAVVERRALARSVCSSIDAAGDETERVTFDWPGATR